MALTKIIVALALVIGLIGFFTIGFLLNRKTPIPEGCELPSLSCEHCTASGCSYSGLARKMKESSSKEGESND